MEKQKLADLVLARMKERREEEERNRPESEVLRMEALFVIERNLTLKEKVGRVEEQLRTSMAALQQFELHGQQLDNTGKRPFPRIIVLPEFIGSERIDPKFKDFYRKSANSFLRYDLLRKKQHELAAKHEQAYVAGSIVMCELEKQTAAVEEEETRNINKRRLAILKQQLYLRKLKKEQEVLRAEILTEETANRAVQEEYTVKRGLVESGCQRMGQIEGEIKRYRQMIERRFNPDKYRQFLGGTFAFCIKNEAIRKNVELVKREIEAVKAQRLKIEGEPQGGRSLHLSRRSLTHPHPQQQQNSKKNTRRLKTQQISTKITQIHTQPSEHHPQHSEL